MTTPHEGPSGRPTPPSDHSTALAQQRTSLADVRSHLANERTHLAYVRTAISLLGFGITLNRFSIYLMQQKAVDERAKVLGLYDVEAVGTGMAVAGLVLLMWSLYRYWQTNRDLERGTFRTHFKLVVGLTLTLLLFGGLSTTWLIGR